MFQFKLRFFGRLAVNFSVAPDNQGMTGFEVFFDDFNFGEVQCDECWHPIRHFG